MTRYIILIILLSPLVVCGQDDPTQKQRFLPPVLQHADGLSLHKDMYILPITWSKEAHSSEMELNFQVSAKIQLFNKNLYFAFTQKSFWQAYNADDSSPFRETNYNPEFFYRIPPGNKWLHNWGADLGIEHESNGRNLPLSRSWDRVYIRPYYARENDVFYAKLWHRRSENPKTNSLDPKGDDNPDIDDYYGAAEWHYMRRLEDAEIFHLMLRGNTNTGNGAIQISYDMPSNTKEMQYRLMIWHGYGESLIDYNQRITRVSVGVSIFR